MANPTPPPKKNPILLLAAGGAAAIVAAVVAVVLVVAIVINTILSGAGGSSQYLGLDDCIVDGDIRAGGPAATGKKYLTEDQIVGIIYAQAQGIFGPNSADTPTVIAIAAGLAEASLNNGTVGDRVSAGNQDQFRIGNKLAPVGAMTDSRGLYQQRSSYPPNPWSGLKFTYEQSESHFSDRNPQTGEKDAWNPWKTGTRWAIADERMRHDQSTAMFFLGGVSGQPGLEEALAKNRKIKNTLTPIPGPENFSDYELGEMAQYVQRSGPNKYAVHMPKAREYLAAIKTGEIPVPDFIPPVADIAKLASTARTRQALGNSKTASLGDANTPADYAASAGDGLIVVGDSVMQGMLAAANPKSEIFSGPLIKHAMRSISLRTVLEGTTFGVGGTDPQGRKKTPLAEWRDNIASPSTPHTILVELGTNGGGTREQVDQFMTLAGGKNVYWMSQHYSAKASQDFNEILLQAAADYPNLTIVDITGIPGIDTERGPAHPWEGTGTDPRLPMWNQALSTIANGPSPSVIQSLACGGNSAYIGDIQAPSLEAAEAVRWALSKIGSAYVAGANIGNAEGNAFDCSTLTYTALRQSGVNWPMQTSSYQWADAKNLQLIPISEAQPGDLIWSNWGAGDGLAAGHVAIIVEAKPGEAPVAVGAENKESGVKKYSLADYRPSTGFLYPLDPNGPRSASGSGNVGYSQDWKDAWVGRLIGGTPMPGAGVIGRLGNNPGLTASSATATPPAARVTGAAADR